MSFKDWKSEPNHVYIEHDMTRCIAGAHGSKWGHPYKAHDISKKRCLERYEDHLRGTPDLYNALMELEGKELGGYSRRIIQGYAYKGYKSFLLPILLVNVKGMMV